MRMRSASAWDRPGRRGPSKGQFYVASPKLVGDGACIRDGPGQPVEFRHDQRVALADGGEGLAEVGASRVEPVSP